MTDDRSAITQQYAFTVSEDGEIDGTIEPSEESVETSLETFGATVDHRERDTRMAQPEATTFGVDDRPEVTRTDAGEQGALFTDTDDDQQTLTGERAATQCLFESHDDNDHEPNEPTTDEPSENATNESDDPDATTIPQVATDGGRDKEPDDTDERAESADEGETGRDDEQDTTFDPDTETVTEAWEGAYIQASWGYNQTNVELAQIIEVSGSGKTVLARFVAAERVGHGRTSEQLRPTANQYGDEFRLHVRTVSADPAFRGTYPLGSDGDMDDGPTRRGTFYPFGDKFETSLRQTRAGFGH